MAIEKLFVEKGKKRALLEEFLKEKFKRGFYSHSEVERTPLGTRIIVYVERPNLFVGRKRFLQQLAEEIKEKFGFENPIFDIREVENSMLDANIIAYKIAKALERGIHFKKVCNYYLEKIMEAGAIGALIKVGGKLAGKQRSRFQKFKRGFIAVSGEYAERYVQIGRAQAMLKPGVVGVEVRIMKEAPKEIELEKLEE
ncbi:MAG: 30S ribosomal protein S3 [Candidatus Aenigmarchaeota archaeon ex4484_224]|nr:MAG: 30S ribosomal protein S3 [Candidatus Aenigmarchaeota archaeon ex4484_224]